ncbi:hypothetical protein HGA34_01885 [Candidatus Falkowbacteria bacterium]|nr:hypothetical protein [Candidatus Falkowbacteria bacterium]
MGIRVEFNPDLCLRDISEYRAGRRLEAECLPEQLTEGAVYDFLKSDQRLYWLFGELPLRETKGGEKLSLPKASVIIKEVTHFVRDGKIFTKGRYEVAKVLSDTDDYFEGYEIKKRDHEQ